MMKAAEYAEQIRAKHKEILACQNEERRFGRARTVETQLRRKNAERELDDLWFEVESRELTTAVLAEL